ncbi:hypothetical protein H0H92_009117 [Tricholoma furcatifolium]|nr:hypothetical protein H0H92_009117 [Tricholoma furcatifolium]
MREIIRLTPTVSLRLTIPPKKIEEQNNERDYNTSDFSSLSSSTLPPATLQALSSDESTFEVDDDDDSDDSDDSDNDNDRHDNTPGPFFFVETVAGNRKNSRLVWACDIKKHGSGIKGRSLCLKILNRAARKQCFERELEAFKAIAGYSPDGAPFVMRLEAAFGLFDNKELCLAMDYMLCDLSIFLRPFDGVSTRAFRQLHRKKWVAQIATGLMAIHTVGVIHRDLKPENIFLDYRCNLRIGDFGSSYVHRTSSGANHPHHAPIMGTALYLAPEVFNRTADNLSCYSPPIDYWALGLIIFELEQDVESSQHLFKHCGERNAFARYVADGSGALGDYLSRLSFVDRISGRATSLVNGLLCFEAKRRFGYRQICNHLYFSGKFGCNEHATSLNSISAGEDLPFVVPHNLQECVYVSSGPLSNSEHMWVNPQGLWGRDSLSIDI